MYQSTVENETNQAVEAPRVRANSTLMSGTAASKSRAAEVNATTPKRTKTNKQSVTKITAVGGTTTTTTTTTTHIRDSQTVNLSKSIDRSARLSTKTAKTSKTSMTVN